MRQRFFPKPLIIALFSLLCITLSVQAQSTYIPITAQNVAQITQVERIGNGVPRAMTFSPDGSWLALSTTLGTWWIDLSKDLGEGQSIPLENVASLGEGQGGGSSVAFSPDGKRIATGGDDGSIEISAAIIGAPMKRLESHIYPVSALAWSADGNLLSSGDWSGVVRLWDTSNWHENRVLQVDGTVRRLSLDDQVFTVQTDDQMSTWDIAQGELISQTSAKFDLSSPLSANLGVWRAEITDGKLHIFDHETDYAVLNGLYGELGDVFFDAFGRVGASPLKPTYLWSVRTGDIYTLPKETLSPEGSRRATFGNDGVIHLKNGETQAEIAYLYGHTRAVTDVAFSPDGRLLVSSSNDGTIQLWDATATQGSGSLMVLTGHNGGVSSVAFNADGTLIASSGYDGTVRLWGIKS